MRNPTSYTKQQNPFINRALGIILSGAVLSSGLSCRSSGKEETQVDSGKKSGTFHHDMPPGTSEMVREPSRIFSSSESITVFPRHPFDLGRPVCDNLDAGEKMSISPGGEYRLWTNGFIYNAKVKVTSESFVSADVKILYSPNDTSPYSLDLTFQDVRIPRNVVDDLACAKFVSSTKVATDRSKIDELGINASSTTLQMIRKHALNKAFADVLYLAKGSFDEGSPVTVDFSVVAVLRDGFVLEAKGGEFDGKKLVLEKNAVNRSLYNPFTPNSNRYWWHNRPEISTLRIQELTVSKDGFIDAKISVDIAR